MKGAKMAFEDEVLGDFRRGTAGDRSFGNMIRVFTENYSRTDGGFDRSGDEAMLLFQYGVYGRGGGKRLEVDFVRQLVRGDDIIQVHMTAKVPFFGGLSDVQPFSEWYNSAWGGMPPSEWGGKIGRSPVFALLPPVPQEVEFWIDHAE